MKTHYKLALAMLAGVGLGAVAVQALHAQAKPPVYYVAEVDVADPDGYAKEYAPKARASINAAGGRVIAVGGAAGSGAKVTALDGDAPKRAVVVVWDSIEQIQAWRAGDYKEIRKIGEKYAKYRTFAVDGVPQ